MGLHDEWYQNAIIYCLDVETYADSNGDGTGDFAGLTQRLDYLAGLGVTCLWLIPFYPTPNRDDGYDVTDYVAIDPRLGTMADFTDFMLEAGERGIRVMIDLVPNHTSDQHPWFQAARSDPRSPYRDYYVWRQDDPGDTSDQVIFPGEQDGIWSWDEEADAYYHHYFYAFQPDLNFANPAVREEFRRIIGFWLQQGVSGFRIDAVPYLIDLTGTQAEGHMQDGHAFLEELQAFTTIRSGNAILLGEVNQPLSKLADYFGGGNQLQAIFNFSLTRYCFLGLARKSAESIRFGLQQLPTIPEKGQWVNFLRHHDELNLSHMTADQQDQIYATFADDPKLQVFDRGIRRRLAPMLKGDQRWIRLAYSLLFSLPGSPMIFYGEEIGMGEQLQLEGRMSVRAPMPWTPYDCGGFSTAPHEDFVRPLLSGREYGFEQVNVASQRSDPDSLLNWMASLVRTRRECGEIGRGDCRIVDVDRDAILALRHDVEDSAVLILNNLSDKRHTVTLELGARELETATDLFCDRRYEPVSQNRHIRMNGYGFRWLRLGGVY